MYAFKVIVRKVCEFELRVETEYPEDAIRAVSANWDSIYKHRAVWRNGVAPQLQDGEPTSVTVEIP